jgi:SAM-dependent methyltransferase
VRTSVLEYLACPACGGALVADTGGTQPSEDGHLMSGSLVSGCGAHYPIIDGIPRLTPDHANLSVDRSTRETAHRFGNEWKIFDFQEDYYEKQLLDWLRPLGREDFAGKVVLEGGCGKGRHSRLIGKFGAKAVISLDLGDAVEVAFAATRELLNVHIVQADIHRPPVQRVFDIAFSIGVLHHLPHPEVGFRALVDRVKDGGRIAIWVYGQENNEWIVRFVDPIRKELTSRISERWLYWLSVPPSLLVKAALRAYRSEQLSRKLPYGSYMHYISKFPFREVHSIVFDQLVTPLAHYLPEGEVRRWFPQTEFENLEVAWHNENSWRATAIVGKRKEPARPARKPLG